MSLPTFSWSPSLFSWAYHLAKNTSIRISASKLHLSSLDPMKKWSLHQNIFLSVTRKQKLSASEFPMIWTWQTVKRRYEFVGEWRLSILKHHSQPTSHSMARWQRSFFPAFVTIWVICIIFFALKTFRKQGKLYLRAVGLWRPFLAIEICCWKTRLIMQWWKITTVTWMQAKLSVG